MGRRGVPTVGFDFGTSTTMVANGDELISLASDSRGRFMASVVGHDDTGAVVVGEAAELLEFPIRSIKRAITADRQFVRAVDGMCCCRQRCVGCSINGSCGTTTAHLLAATCQ